MNIDVQPTVAAKPNENGGTPWPITTAFICTNGAREGLLPSAVRPRPNPPRFVWPGRVLEVLVPCTGRIQPEHLLKAFENGSSLVCVFACQKGNCHTLEGNLRAKRRVEYVEQLLGEIGLEGQRLMWFTLPGSAREDMAVGVGEDPGTARPDSPPVIPADISQQIKDRLKTLTPNPLMKFHPSHISYYDLDDANENED